MLQCIAGCNRRRITARRERNGTTNALMTGMQFWMDTNAYASRTEHSPIKSVQLGCMDTVTSPEANDFEDTIEGLIFVNINETEQHPIRYIVQWKQRTYDGSPTGENGWITASIESEPIFKVKGMLPVMQYKFMVTAVGPGGRLGGPVMSDWAQSLTVDHKLHAPVGPLMITTQYNNEDGLSALVNWYHSPYQQKPPPDISDDRLMSFGNCHYSITVLNETSRETLLFTLDNGNGILISNLQFSTEYSVALRSISSERIDLSLSQQRNVSHEGDTTPEPVKNLEAMVNSNGSVIIQWVPPSEPNAILVYQLLYQSLTNHYDCDKDPSSIYINAGSTTATIQLHSRTHCEYSIKLINYDLIGREASTEIIIWYRPDTHSFKSNLIYIYPILMLISIIISLKCCICLCCSNTSSDRSMLLSSCSKKDTVTIL
uniref:Fibronectin type-III domain-containing protein n=1 Tax=Elaeophora elaphi TaxID=1147741 RepID=A0A0R3RYP7_9BILA